MKKLTIIIACLTACTLFAQPTPVPTPSASPSLPQAAMALPPQTSAALVAGQIITQLTTLLNNVLSAIDNGVPASQGQPAIDGKDIQAALGTENVMKLRSAVALLSTGQPAQTPPVTPAMPSNPPAAPPPSPSPGK